MRAESTGHLGTTLRAASRAPLPRSGAPALRSGARLPPTSRSVCSRPSRPKRARRITAPVRTGRSAGRAAPRSRGAGRRARTRPRRPGRRAGRRTSASASAPSPIGSSSARGVRSTAIRFSTCSRVSPVRLGQLGGGGLVPVGLQMRPTRVLDPRELAQRAVGQHHRAGDLGDELLHRLPHPPRCIAPERRAAPGSYRSSALSSPTTPSCISSPRSTARSAPVDARDARDRGHEHVHQPGARFRVPLSGRAHQNALLARQAAACSCLGRVRPRLAVRSWRRSASRRSAT